METTEGTSCRRIDFMGAMCFGDASSIFLESGLTYPLSRFKIISVFKVKGHISFHQNVHQNDPYS
jgi:hypothetical protein